MQQFRFGDLPPIMPMQVRPQPVISKYSITHDTAPVNGLTTIVANNAFYGFANLDPWSNFGVYNAPIAAPAPAPAPAPKEVIVIQDDDEIKEVAAPVARVASISKPKPSSHAWKLGKKVLDKYLNNQGGSDQSLLYESLKNLPSDKRNRYCEANWHTEQNAKDDIFEMSKLFLDAQEMVLYAAQWDALVREKGEKAQAEIDAAKSALRQALPDKRWEKREREQQGQFSDWLMRMKGPEFYRLYKRDKSPAAVQDVLREQREERARERQSLLTARKRKADRAQERVKPAKKPKITASRQPPKKASAPVVQPAREETDLDAEGETDDEYEREKLKSLQAEASSADNAAILIAARPTQEALSPSAPPSPSPSRSPSPFNDPSHADLEIINPDLDSSPEHVTAVTAATPPPAYSPPVPLGKHTAAQHTDEGYSSPTVKPPAPDKSSEQATAPKSLTSTTTREENTVVEDETFADQVTVPLLITDTAQEENTVVIEKYLEDEEIDDLFEEDEMTEEENTPTTNTQTGEDLPDPVSEPAVEIAVMTPVAAPDLVEDLPAAISEAVVEVVAESADAAREVADVLLDPLHGPVVETAAVTPVGATEVAGDLPAPVSEATKAMLIQADQHHERLVAAKQVEIADVEQSIAQATTHYNALVRKRKEKDRPVNEAKLQVLKVELQRLQERSQEEKVEMWKENDPTRVVALETYFAQKAEREAITEAQKKNDIMSCGGSKVKF